MNLKDFITLDDGTLLRLARWLGVAVLFTSPGVLLLVLENVTSITLYGTPIQCTIAVVLSIPFLFLGGITYLHPYKTMLSFLKYKPSEVGWMIAFGAGLWANLSVAICYGLVRLTSAKLNELVSHDLRLHYIVVYGVLFDLAPVSRIP